MNGSSGRVLENFPHPASFCVSLEACSPIILGEYEKEKQQG